MTDPASPHGQLVDTTAQAWRTERRILGTCALLLLIAVSGGLLLGPGVIRGFMIAMGWLTFIGFGIAVGQCMKFRRDHRLWFNNRR